jgi:hypothetical protein
MEIEVPIVTIDSFLAERRAPVSFVKIDVQGFEPYVCRGMLDTIRRTRALNVFLEYSPRSMRELGSDPHEVFHPFIRNGFKCYTVGHKAQVSPVIPSDMTCVDYVDLLFTRDYNLETWRT